MDIHELKNALQQLDVPPEFYSILEGQKPDAIVLEHYHGIWETYYFSERGEIFEERYHPSEDDACQYVLNRFEKMKKNSDKSKNDKA